MYQFLIGNVKPGRYERAGFDYMYQFLIGNVKLKPVRAKDRDVPVVYQFLIGNVKHKKNEAIMVNQVFSINSL